jgi:glucan 1,3-beta-glucosidase
MLGNCIDVQDQGQLTDILLRRFGEERGMRLMDLYRESYITPRDFELIKRFGFNLVRVPFDYRMLQDEAPPYAMRADAFRWLDRALELAESAGVYVILDMHGVPSGQSNQFHTGRANQEPEIWDDPAAQQRMCDLWKRIAERYKDRSVIAAYDIVNEPYADYKTDITATLRELMFKAYAAVRSTGDRHVVLFPAALGRGVSFYGDVRGRGCEQFAFTDHYYPGLFGSPSTLVAHARTIYRDFPAAQSYLEAQQAPMLAGEFNVVLDRCGGERMMRRYYDEFARRGWMATMWSYKLLKQSPRVEADNWYMVTNAAPLNAVDVNRDDYATIETFMESMATIPLAVDEPLRVALTDAKALPIELPTLPELPKSAPVAQQVDGWTGTAVNCPCGGGIEQAGDRLVVTASGSDVFGATDSFYFLHRPMKSGEPSLLVARVERLRESDAYAKAGVMVRIGHPDAQDYASAPFAMVNVFPDGTIAFLCRDRAGATAQEAKRFPGPMPRRIGLLRDGPRVQGIVEDAAGHWVSVGELSSPDFDHANARAGLAVCSHSTSAFTRAEFADATLVGGPSATNIRVRRHLAAALPAAPKSASDQETLLNNGCFGAEGHSASALKGWNQWGSIEVARAGQPTVKPNAPIRFVADGDSGLWQDVAVQPGQPCRFSVLASRSGGGGGGDGGGGGGGAPARGAGFVELRLESPLEGKVLAVASSEVSLDSLETGDGWSTLTVTGTPLSDTLRVLVRVSRAPGKAPNGFAVSLKSAALSPAR